MNARYIILLLIVIASGCASTSAIHQPVTNGIDVEQARNSESINQPIRWGGKIITLENKNDYSIIEIVDKPLTRFGVPRITHQSGGRFMARTEAFIDPEAIEPDSYITVTGNIVDYQNQKIGDYDYRYPVVEISEYKIWPQYTADDYPRRYYPPFYYHRGHFYHDVFGDDPYFHHFFHPRHHFYHQAGT